LAFQTLARVCAIFTERISVSNWPGLKAADWKPASPCPTAPRAPMPDAMAREAQFKTLIVDDEAPARARLRQLLKEEPDFAVVAECANGRQAVEAIAREKPDLAFLDVQMPRLSGLEVCQAAAAGTGPMPLIIFVTAYDEYALEAFEVHAIDYLLKPFD